MSVKVIIECPLGGQCESVEKDGIHRCAWYTHLRGITPDGQDVDEWKCAMTWMPIMLTENAQTNRGQTQAIESFRNASLKEQKRFNDILHSASTRPRELTDE